MVVGGRPGNGFGGSLGVTDPEIRYTMGIEDIT